MNKWLNFVLKLSLDDQVIKLHDLNFMKKNPYNKLHNFNSADLWFAFCFLLDKTKTFYFDEIHLRDDDILLLN